MSWWLWVSDNSGAIKRSRLREYTENSISLPEVRRGVLEPTNVLRAQRYGSRGVVLVLDLVQVLHRVVVQHIPQNP